MVIDEEKIAEIVEQQVLTPREENCLRQILAALEPLSKTEVDIVMYQVKRQLGEKP